ncbi:MAG: tripartite tricarboxylate transporter substrate binding protein [Rhodobacterales bacterium]|nr:tripartite tricarboxylate transporter substrate binding protein [Rhodobacterales bacterium]
MTLAGLQAAPAQDFPAGDIRYVLHVEPGGATDVMACSLVLDPYLLAVRTDSGIDSLQDMVAKAKAQPGSLSISGFGGASGGHVAWMMFSDSAGLGDGDINWVPYNSVGDAVVATLGGHNDVVIGYIGLVKQHVAAGTLKVIGLMSDARSELLPDAPTFAEAGFPVDTRWQQFRGVIVPADTPVETQENLCAAVDQALKSPEIAKYIAESDLVPGFMGPAAFTDFVLAQEATAKLWAERLAAGN